MILLHVPNKQTCTSAYCTLSPGKEIGHPDLHH